MGEAEILDPVTRWIKEDKSSFLVRALENQDTSLGEIVGGYRALPPLRYRRE